MGLIKSMLIYVKTKEELEDEYGASEEELACSYEELLTPEEDRDYEMEEITYGR